MHSKLTDLHLMNKLFKSLSDKHAKIKSFTLTSKPKRKCIN